MNTAPVNEDIVGSATLTIISGAKKFNKWMYEEIKPHLNGLVLELGSGTGNISEFLLEDNLEVFLSDYNTSYIDYLEKKFSGYSNLREVLSIDLQDPHFEKKYEFLYEKFDAIFLLNVIEHLKDDLTAVSNCHFMLKSGGHLILLAPAFNFLFCDLDRNLGHYRRYNMQTLSNLLKKNSMSIVEKKYFNLAGIPGWFIWGKFLRKQQLQRNSMRIFDMLVPFFRIADRFIFKKAGLSVITTGKKI